MAIDGLGGQCTPSYQLQQGNSPEEETAAGMLTKGWSVLVPDHEGIDMEYGAGKNGAHITLDSIRALYNFEAAGITPANPLGLIGYSGGGQATAWTEEQQPTYAPEIHITAAAPGGIPVDLEEVAHYNDGQPSFGLVLAASEGVARGYPEFASTLETILNEAGVAAEKTVSKECLDEYVEQFPNRKFSEFTKPEYREPLSVPGVEKTLNEDSLAKAVPQAPTFLWQSAADEVIPVAGVDKLADYYCSEGLSVTYDRGASGEHISYADNAPAAVAYLEAYFNGETVPSTCGVNASTNTKIESSPSGVVREASVTFKYAADPAVEGTAFECRLDGGEFASCPSSSVTYTGLSVGNHTFAVRAVTPTGHTDVSPATVAWRYVASEHLPEIGRCAAAAGTGFWTDGACLGLSAEGTGSFEWLPGPGPKPAFTSEIPQVVLETTGKAVLSCTGNTLAGEWTGSKTASVKLVLKGCHSSAGKTCQSGSTAGGIEPEGAIEAQLGFIKAGLRPSVGLDLSRSGSLLKFTCGELLEVETWTVEGSVIGRITPIDAAKSKFTLLYSATGGVQSIQKFTTGSKDTLTVKRTAGTSETVEAAGLTLRRSPEKRTVLAIGREPLEIKAKA
jgi:pimeloyl-ACP methyl ester carboxylesterase